MSWVKGATASPTQQQTVSDNNCCLANRYLQITLLVVGVLALGFGYFYFKDMARIGVMSGGGLLIALALIGICACKSDTKSKTIQEKSEKPTKFTAAEKAILQSDEIGKALLDCCSMKPTLVGEAFYKRKGHQNTPAYHFAFKWKAAGVGAYVYNLVLIPEISESSGKVVHWGYDFLGEVQDVYRWNASKRDITKDLKTFTTFFKELFEGKQERYELTAFPQTDGVIH